MTECICCCCCGFLLFLFFFVFVAHKIVCIECNFVVVVVVFGHIVSKQQQQQQEKKFRCLFLKYFFGFWFVGEQQRQYYNVYSVWYKWIQWLFNYQWWKRWKNKNSLIKMKNIKDFARDLYFKLKKKKLTNWNRQTRTHALNRFIYRNSFVTQLLTLTAGLFLRRVLKPTVKAIIKINFLNCFLI